MRQKLLALAFIFSLFLPTSAYSFYQSHPQDSASTAVEHAAEHTAGTDGHLGDEAHSAPPTWTVIPFVLLLLMIATGPLFYEHFWHKNYPKIAVALAALMIGYYVFVLHNVHGPVHSMMEYVQFIALLSSLYIASGGILITVNKKAPPLPM